MGHSEGYLEKSIQDASGANVHSYPRWFRKEFFVHSMGSPELQVFLEGHAADFAFQANAQAVAEFSRVVKDSTGFLVWTC